MKNKARDSHIFATQRPNAHCPEGFSYGVWCSRCGATRGIVVPCAVKDFTGQMQAFAESHKSCKAEVKSDEA